MYAVPARWPLYFKNWQTYVRPIRARDTEGHDHQWVEVKDNSGFGPVIAKMCRRCREVRVP
jgi:hypothetical protein